MPSKPPDAFQKVKELTRQMSYASANGDVAKMKELDEQVKALTNSPGPSAKG
jgi:hypothetical protein